MKPTVSIVFPTLNEEAVLGKTLEQAESYLKANEQFHPYEIIVVDNASSDHTPELVEAISKKYPEIRLVRHPKNLGYAMSNLTAFREAKGDVVVVADGDGQLSMEDLPAMFEKLAAGSDIVFGWRRQRNDPPVRILVSYFLNFLSKFIIRWPYHDINCGYRVVTREVADEIRTAMPVNFFGPELWAWSVRHGWRVSEVPVVHFARDGGTSIHAFWRLPVSMWRGLEYLFTLREEMKKKVVKRAQQKPEIKKPELEKV